MDKVLADIGQMLSVIVVAMVIVLVAMAIDLVSGVNKAKANGQMRTSWGLKRTISKFVMYEGGLLIAAGVDILMHSSHLYDLLRLEALRGVPFVTCLVGVFLCVVEFLSVKESADIKMQKEFADAGRLLGNVFSKEDLREAIKDAIKDSRKR
jgi:choline-glycine betaine transporter